MKVKEIIPVVCPRLNKEIEGSVIGLQALIGFSDELYSGEGPYAIMCSEYKPPVLPGNLDRMVGDERTLIYGTCKQGKDNEECIYAKWNLFKVETKD